MNEVIRPSEPDTQAQLSPGHGRPGARLRRVLWAALLATLALLTANAWLVADWVRQQHGRSREHAFWTLCHPGCTAAEREGAFRRLVADGNIEWRSANLQQLNLTGISLAKANLDGASFRRSTLPNANLAGASLRNGSLELADLTGADLSEADLTETQLLQAILKNANLRRAKMRAAVLEQVQAENADLLVADLSDADCLMANLAGAKLNGANLAGAKLESVSFRGANLALARMEGTDLTDADFTQANWWRARGLTSDQLELLKKRFAPGSDAPAALQQDYAKWLNGGAE